MYSVFIITNKKKFVLATYQDFSPELSDQTKLQLILNGPTVPVTVFEQYFKAPEDFEIKTFKSGIDNALEASLEVNNINLVQANKKATADARVPVLPKTKASGSRPA